PDRRLWKRRPSCRPKTPVARGGLIAGTPQPATLEAIAPLRRPAVAGDTLSAPAPGSLAFGEIYADFTRTVTTTLGQQVRILPGRLMSPVAVPSESCRDAEAEEARRLASRRPAAVRKAVERILRDVRADDAAAPRPTETPAEGVFLGVAGQAGALLQLVGQADMADFAERGLTGVSGNATDSVILGLVPDGVASVEFVFPRVVEWGRLYKPTVFARTIRLTASVKDNVVALRSPRPPMESMLATTMIWRSAAGDVVNTVEPKGLG
ncbi:MAG: hypothetical protein ACEQSX_17225, partial [Baekduiaceae bacterium]